jgi:nucleolar complex protein 3
MCTHEDSTVRKLAILSELAVLKDIIPSYRIIAEDEDQSGVTLSKEVKKVREFELGLLKAYQRYLRTLEDVIKSTRVRAPPFPFKSQTFPLAEALERGKANKKALKQKQRMQEGAEDPSDPLLQHKLVMGVGAAAVKALGELLSTQYHFNFRANLIAALVPVMDCRHEELSSVACFYMTALFKNDAKGSCSLEAVRAMFQLIKSRQYSVRPEILLTFLALPLSTEMGEDVDIFDQKRQQSSKKHLSKKQKKVRKEQKALDKEMQQATAEQSREEKIRIVRRNNNFVRV